jgi:DNA primase
MEIQDIKATLSLQTVLNHYNLSPDRNHRLNCPWHNDKTPSLQIYPKTNTWTCFSSNCTAGSGDAIEMIKKMDKCTKHEALKKAAELCGEIKTEPGLKEKPALSLVEVFTAQRKSVHRTKKAVEYMKGRSIDPMKIEVGYNSYQSGYKQLQNCITFPLKDKSGNITSLYGRSIADKKGSNHYYLKNRKGLYPSYPSVETKTLIITEAIIDAATLLTHTDYTVLSLYGTNGWNEEHTEAIKSLSQLEEVIFFMDGDEAGNKAIEIYAPLVKTMKPSIKISKVETNEGEDINSLVISHEPEILTHLINERTFLFSTEEPSTEKEKVTEQNQALELNTENPEYLFTEVGELRFTIMGGIGLYPLDKMKVTLKIEKVGSNRPLHRLRQNIDLYQDDSVEKLARKVAERLEIGSTKVHEALLQLTELIEDYRREQIEANKVKEPEKRILTEIEKGKALKFLKSKNLLKRTNQAIGKSGVIGEENNRLLMYLVFTSRLRQQPLHIVSLGGSGTGKTYLQEKVAELIPDDQKLEITAISENALYYFDRKELKNKLVLIEDLDGANDDKVLFAIRELQSKRRISKTIPIKDSKGNLKTITLQVEGPISLAGTTTRERLYEDNANRSLLIYLDGSKDHKEKIMAYQRQVSAGKINRIQEEQMRQFMQDVQSVLRPMKVINPFAEMLALPQSVFKPLRTNSHYLHFIETVTFYHQWQREVHINRHTGEQHIETTIEDIEQANYLLKQVLLSKSDELTKACRKFLELIKSYLQYEKKSSFYSGDIRIKYRMAPTTLNRHLKDLRRYGYVKIVSGSKSKGFEYELENIGEITGLESNLQTAFDEALERIKNKYGSPVDHPLPSTVGGQHKAQKNSALDAVAQ